MECQNCEDSSCQLCGLEIVLMQRCLRCQYAAEPINAYCELCFEENNCGFLERIEP